MKKILSILILCALIVSALVSCSSDGRIDFLKDNLSKYIYLSADYYKNYPVNVTMPVITDSDVERQILYLLYENRDENPTSDGAYIVNEPISVGDVAYVLYRGYTVDENGVETEIENSSSLVAGELSPVTIGALKYVPGFEEGLIGVVPKDCVKFEKITEGSVEEGDVVYLSYTLLSPDGASKTVKSERIELSKEWIDDRYGEGFSAFFIGKTVGEKIKDSLTAELKNGTAVYYDMTVDFVTKCEDECLTIDVRFPDDYGAAELRGVEAKFDMYISYVQIYNAPEFNDAFVTDVLKVSAETLADYEGDSISEKYRAKIRADLEKANEDSCRGLIEEAMWDYYHEHAEIKSLPKGEVDAVYNEYYNEVASQYSAYSAYYSTIDAFAAAYFGLASNVNWLDYIRTQAEGVIIEKLIFYYVIREEGFVPTDAEYEKLYNENVKECVDYHAGQEFKTELDACKTEEERAAKLAEIEETVKDYYGEEYFSEMVYYSFAIDKLIDFADVK